MPLISAGYPAGVYGVGVREPFTSEDTYFKDNPVHKKVELDGGWSPEGSEFEIELKILGKEDPKPKKVKVIRVPSDCKFFAFIHKSLTLEPKWKINYDSESQLSEVFLGPFTDLNCGALDFSVDGKCYTISAKSDQSVNLAWDPLLDDCSSSFLTISLK